MQFFSYETLDSTNEQAKRLLKDGEIEQAACVVAKEQTAGRGTRGRSWLSPKNAGIYMSLALRHERDTAVEPTELYSLAAGAACAEVLSQLSGLDVKLKPINDLIADGGKLGGILTEAVIERGKVRWLIVGVGINLSQTARPLPPEAPPAVSLEELLTPFQFAELSVEILVEELAESILKWMGFAQAGQSGVIERQWSRFKVPGTVFPQLGS